MNFRWCVIACGADNTKHKTAHYCIDTLHAVACNSPVRRSPRSLHVTSYSQLASQDLRPNGPNPWKVLQHYPLRKGATQPLEQILCSEFLWSEVGRRARSGVTHDNTSTSNTNDISSCICIIIIISIIIITISIIIIIISSSSSSSSSSICILCSDYLAQHGAGRRPPPPRQRQGVGDE